MLIYFDESYNNDHRYLILGALFNPHSKFLHREWLKVKREYRFIDNRGKALEIKYNNCNTSRRQEMCFRAIDIFLKAQAILGQLLLIKT